MSLYLLLPCQIHIKIFIKYNLPFPQQNNLVHIYLLRLYGKNFFVNRNSHAKTREHSIILATWQCLHYEEGFAWYVLYGIINSFHIAKYQHSNVRLLENKIRLCATKWSKLYIHTGYLWQSLKSYIFTRNTNLVLHRVVHTTESNTVRIDPYMAGRCRMARCNMKNVFL
jgi:hypothetical protein